tara:strand:+ start:218 stop:463 length:246 start_codon:yes stop_codon:yes gene_type:complete
MKKDRWFYRAGELHTINDVVIVARIWRFFSVNLNLSQVVEKVIELALAAGVKRIGVNQKGTHRFIHLDVCDDKTSPTIWSY